MRTVYVHGASLLLANLLACGGSEEGDATSSDGGGSTSGGSATTGGDGGSTTSDDGSSATTGGSTTTTGAGTTTGGSTTTGGDTTTTGGTTTSGSTTTTSGSTTTTSGSTTTSGANVAYAAFAWPGGLDRIGIRKADYDAGMCTSVVVVWPAGGGGGQFPSITTPNEWAVEVIGIYDTTTQCLESSGMPPGQPEFADGGAGVVDFLFTTPGMFPCELDIDVTATFSAPPSWVPASSVLDAAAVPVQGC